jgi:hypothetical protein
MVRLLHFKDRFTKHGQTLCLSEGDFLKLVISKTQVKETSDGFVLGQFSGTSRLNENFIETGYIALDFDSGNRLSEIRKKFENYWHVIYTSLSHTNENQKFRLILKLTEPLVRTDYQSKMKHLIEQLGTDRSCSNPSRLWFGGKEVVSFNFSGELYRLRNVRAATPTYSAQNSLKSGLSEKSKYFLQMGAPKGEWHQARLSFLMNAYHQGFNPSDVREMFSKNHTLDRNDEFHINDVYQRYFNKKSG